MEKVKSAVSRVYGSVAAKEDSGRGHQEGARRVAQAFGYTEEELSSIPQEANMGLSCGNSVKYANLKEGEVVVDLGSGGGLDCFLAAQKVGKSGSVIGVDMTEEMITLAMKNAAKMGAKASIVDFRKGEIENIPIDDNTADCVMSNCVLNLVPDKQKAFREIHRVLKPGGRLAASDIALKQPLPKELWSDLMTYVGCIGGAVLIEDYVQQLKDAGFSDIVVVDTGADLNAYTEIGPNCCAPAAEDLTGLAAAASAGSSCCAPADSCCAPATKPDSCCAPATKPESCCAPATKVDPCCAPAVKSDPCCAPAPASCCAPAPASAGCCGEKAEGKGDDVEFGTEMTNMLSKFDVNAYAASVRVMALKPALP
ncbi:methyltransferase domain containing protein [Acanthamoeba castellanii str. Neff]|uniref:Arsenite methyltransferase n=1 Tax=Acanthamoeba castellanii (strain ATCC 30010 / Neff) TaxID=1257118 RepID=L8HJF9_ACACF|nr:methyltransferase domain containing protein [Acanthamoeba castellanii str. Neff]ELR24531.1 methyltransferase domain containing protein [Acanthamoeba castellanii str. Neff]